MTEFLAPFDLGGEAEPGPPALRIGNASGFYGDRFTAMREMLTGGQLDVLTGDFLAELTMLILGRDRARDPAAGYAKTFLRQLEECLALARDYDVSIVANAGGLAPARLAEEVRVLAARLGLDDTRVAHVEGDDLLPRSAELGLGPALAANAYLGAFGIAECLRAGANVVVTGRVTDASLVVGPAAARFGWTHDDLDAVAGATVAGHVLECGTQATGGNYAFFLEHLAGGTDLTRPGFPLAEVHADGSSVITKHEGTGGRVDVGTVTAQLLYEIGSPRYAGPDVTARFDTVRLEQIAPDRVLITGVRGEPPPPTLKVGLAGFGGHRNEMTFVLTGLDVEAKAELTRAQLESLLPAPRPKNIAWTLARTDHPDAPAEEEASALLRVVVRDPDPEVAGRAFSNAAVELALGGYPGLHLTTPPGPGSPYGVFSAAYVQQETVPHTAVLPDGRRVTVGPPPRTGPVTDLAEPAMPSPPPPGPTRRAPLGAVAGARSGDKGGDANVGVWARDDRAFTWLAHTLTTDQFQRLLPETAALPVTRHVLPNLRALNFVVTGLLGEGVASGARFDAQAKAVGEWLRSRHVDIPEGLL